MACGLQAQMFAEAVGIEGLEVQLVYFRGLANFYYRGGGECKASPWMAPDQLTPMMTRIVCQAGETQIGKVLDHVKKEALMQRVSALVFVGDACEENDDGLFSKARDVGVPCFMFQETNAQSMPWEQERTEQTFKAIASASHGAYCRFDAGAAKQLGELLRAVLAFVVGGVAALENQKTRSSVLLLSQLKKG